MTIDPEFLSKLVCPDKRVALREATAAELEATNAAIAAGGVVNRGGVAVTEPLESGLVPDGGGVVYPVVDGIPVLLIDESLPLRATDEVGSGGSPGA